MFKAYGKYWKNYMNFSGRATRPDYWWVFLINGIITIVSGIFYFIIIIPVEARAAASGTIDTSAIASMTHNLLMHNTGYFVFEVVSIFWGLVNLPPMTSLMARRLRDAGHSWDLAIISGIIGFINIIINIATFPTVQSGVFPIIWTMGAGIYELVVAYIFCAQPTRKLDDSIRKELF